MDICSQRCVKIKYFILHRTILMILIVRYARKVKLASLARIGAGFGSAQADIFPAESLRILAERLSQWEIETHH